MLIRILLILSLICCTKNYRNSKDIVYVKTYPIIEQKYLENVPVSLVKSHEIPMIVAKFKFKNAGQKSDSIDKIGRANLSIILLNDKNYINEETSLELTSIGSKIDFASDLDNFYITLTSISSNFAKSIEILQDILSNIRIDEKDLELAKIKLLSNLNFITQTPSLMAKREFTKNIFTHPDYKKVYMLSKESMDKISIDDISSYINNNLSLGNLSIYISGDIDQNIDKSLTKFISKLSKNNAKLDFSPLPISNYKSIKNPILIDKKIKQANIIFGQILEINSENKYHHKMINYILGGRGLQSRLMKEIREKRGLTYGIRTNIEKYDLEKLFIGSVATKSENVYEVISLVKESIKNVKSGNITDQELKLAKLHMVDMFNLDLDNEKIAYVISKINPNKFDENYFKNRAEKINKITLDEINHVAKNMLDPDNLTFVVIGDKNLMRIIP